MPCVRLMVIAGVAYDGERFQSEKIHLEQAEITDRPHGVLRDNGA